MTTRKFGDFGEEVARNLLIKKGYTILSRNFRSKFGEIDIIARDGDTLVVAEVKTRWSKKFGTPEEAVTPWKLARIRKTAEYFCLLNKNLPKKLRIVVAIEIEKGILRSAKIIKVD